MDFSNVLPPVALFKGAGNPYQTAFQTQIQNRTTQNNLVNTHGGKRKLRGGNNSDIVVPQAPTAGMIPAGPNTASAMTNKLAGILVNAYNDSQYDSAVQTGGLSSRRSRSKSLIKRLRKLANTKTKRSKSLKKRRKTRKKK